MSSNTEKAEEISNSLIYIKEQLKMLKEERDKLLKANQELVSLALEMDEMIREKNSKIKDISLDSQNYPSNSSWRSKNPEHSSPDSLRDDAEKDIERIEKQISAIRDTVKDLQRFKNQ